VTESALPAEDLVRLIAFYLPQFHPTPENDAWWGPGFTEWTNVAAARPRFPGHNQPRLPKDLGFYDLRLPEVREQQADLARRHGISAFCYYHYWFAGRRVLDRPVREILASGRPDFPFLLCWANESWTRAWDEGAHDVLIEQTYSEADDAAHIEHLLDVFEDPRYLRLEGKPVFLVYRASAMPAPVATTTRWRQAAQRRGFPDLWLCRVDRTEREMERTPAELGFDAAVDFQPGVRLGQRPVPASLVGSGLRRLSRRRWAPPVTVYDYAERARRVSERPAPPYVRYPCVFPDWDNTARRRSGAMAFRGASPSAYGDWLEATIRRSLAEQDRLPLVFVNAWNEWAEGCYLEPDARWGDGYLDATRAALQRATAVGA
jgi:lipopolysaccharide biosynthesis protein